MISTHNDSTLYAVYTSQLEPVHRFTSNKFMRDVGSARILVVDVANGALEALRVEGILTGTAHSALQYGDRISISHNLYGELYVLIQVPAAQVKDRRRNQLSRKVNKQDQFSELNELETPRTELSPKDF